MSDSKKTMVRLSCKNKTQSQNPSAEYVIYGKHAVTAALLNTKRGCKELWITQNVMSDLQNTIQLSRIRPNLRTNLVSTREFAQIFPNSEGSRCIALRVTSLAQPKLSDLLDTLQNKRSTIILLDQVNDPQNLGAVLRTALAFESDAIIVPKDNSANDSGTVAKVASGALELVPLVTVSNLSNAIIQLKEHGFWIIGLDAHCNADITTLHQFEKVGLVFGNEGEGMRRLTRDNCDILSKIKISSKMESLNLSTSVAIALYERYSKQ
ncbi:23S rRNA (guanosine(2251)-2'-O)-methyltransferase RlmB [Rickettsiales endosymbiont of Peranema trichophorum]|uniref:23S rRNA (guanosine(2251)-2'-O)-methyltransferase RlmB n=1 Tax=Rickettsiales endosymbiont of Peranema trichophorum TaxID=2486577 RepID=UPI001022F57C|nr:23S rRNA (guanosine(2251)-2'-O)-methyltransferase RlmB [Rickettsiales endosymbiont of Peranema trichophorum]RZI47787.1 23S rRNA (guanosine(2251)-2'-O)-methyltransferase RlmB [Rickettsiales endosymbiont of Peranema trichophorum]